MTFSKSKKSGYFVILILVFGSVFLFMLTAFTGLLVSQKRASGTAVASERALHIAEAGLEYYRWYLAHNPGDITNGTTTPQPYIHRYTDPQTGEIGQFELTVEGTNASCGQVGAIEITSVGYTDSDPNLKRAVRGRYARPIISEYSYILDAGFTWVGGDHEITGPYHSNGQVLMDGTNNSIMTSARSNNGIYGSGPNSNLWEYPVPPISFTGISADLVAMKALAQNSGRYFAFSNYRGYRVVFKSNGTFDVYTVRDTYSFESRVPGTNTWVEDNHVITDSRFLANYTIPSNCAVLFFEDKVWVEGVVTKKVSLVAARPSHSSDPSIILSGNITYSTYDGSVGFMGIAEESVLIPINSPNDMTINGIFVAQKGYFARNHFDRDHTYPNSLESTMIRNNLTINGSIISKGRIATQYTNSSGLVLLSGYRNRYSSYNRMLAENPPPLVPSVSSDYIFFEWEEVSAE